MVTKTIINTQGHAGVARKRVMRAQPWAFLVTPLNRREQLLEAHAMEHLHLDAVNCCECYLGSVLGRIDMHAERALAEGRINNLHDGFRARRP